MQAAKTVGHSSAVRSSAVRSSGVTSAGVTSEGPGTRRVDFHQRGMSDSQSKTYIISEKNSYYDRESDS